MEKITPHPLIKITKEDVKKAREFYNLKDENTIKESLAAVNEWCQKQPHLVEAVNSLGDNVLERLFILGRGSIEGTKQKIEKLFTSRGLISELTINKSIDEFDKFNEIGLYIPLPRLCPVDQSRVMVTQITGKLDDFNLTEYMRYMFMVGEYRLFFDYCIAERFIIDLANIQMGILTKINPVTIKKAEILCTEGFGTKIKGIHLLNAPPFVDKIIFLMKQALKEKVANRIHVHSSYEDLHKHIPKEILPSDFDGDEQNCAKLAAQWKDLLQTDEARRLVKESDKWVTDESKRSTIKFNEEYLGMPGSFRKLNVD